MKHYFSSTLLHTHQNLTFIDYQRFKKDYSLISSTFSTLTL